MPLTTRGSMTLALLAAWLAVSTPAPFTALREAKTVSGVYAVPVGFSAEDELLRALLPNASELWERVDLTVEAPRFAGARWMQSWAAMLLLGKKHEVTALCTSLVRAGYTKSEASCRRTIKEDDDLLFANTARRIVIALELVLGSNDTVRLSGVRVTRYHSTAPPKLNDEAIIGGLTPFERSVSSKLEGVISIAASRGDFVNSMPGDRPIDALTGKRDFVLRIFGHGRERDGKRLYERYERVMADVAGGDVRSNQNGVAPTTDRPGLHVGALNDLAELRFVY